MIKKIFEEKFLFVEDNLDNITDFTLNIGCFILNKIQSYKICDEYSDSLQTLKNIEELTANRIINMISNDSSYFSIESGKQLSIRPYKYESENPYYEHYGTFDIVIEILNLSYNIDSLDLTNCINGLLINMINNDTLNIPRKIVLLSNEISNCRTEIIHELINSIENLDQPLDYDTYEEFYTHKFDDEINLDSNKLNNLPFYPEWKFQPFYFSFTDCITDHTLGQDTDEEYYFKRLEFIFKHLKNIKYNHVFDEHDGSFLDSIFIDCQNSLNENIEEEDIEEENDEHCRKRLILLLDKYDIQYSPLIKRYLNGEMEI